jgi:hypothetical protein
MRIISKTQTSAHTQRMPTKIYRPVRPSDVCLSGHCVGLGFAVHYSLQE